MRFIRGHSLVHVLSPVDVSLYGLHIYLALVRAALLRVGRPGGFSSRTFTLAYWGVWHLTIGFFLQCVFQHLVCLLELASQPCPIWTVFLGICSVIEVYFLSPTCLEGVPSLSENFSGTYCKSWIFCPVQYPRGSLLLSPGLLPSYHSSGGASMVSCFSLSSL